MLRMRIWPLVVLLIGSTFLLAACANSENSTAAATPCNTNAPPSITIEIPAVAPVEDRHLGVAELSTKSTLSNTVPALQRYKETLGLTAVNLNARLDGDVRAEPHWGKWCAAIGHATVKVDWQTTVFLAHELVPGTCADRAVREHEQKHVDLDRSLLPVLEVKLKTALERLPQTTYWQSDGYQAMADLDTRAKQIAQDVFKDFEVERDKQQLTIDTPAEYDRVAALCGRAAFPKLRPGMTTGM